MRPSTGCAGPGGWSARHAPRRPGRQPAPCGAPHDAWLPARVRAGTAGMAAALPPGRAQPACCSWFSSLCRVAMSLAEFTVTSKRAWAQVVKLPVCELNQSDQVEPPTPHDWDTVADDVVGVLSLQVANGVPFSLPEKLTVIVTMTFGAFAVVTDTLLLTVHDTAALQLAPNLIFSSGRTMASGSTAPRSACASACRAA